MAAATIDVRQRLSITDTNLRLQETDGFNNNRNNQNRTIFDITGGVMNDPVRPADIQAAATAAGITLISFDDTTDEFTLGQDGGLGVILRIKGWYDDTGVIYIGKYRSKYISWQKRSSNSSCKWMQLDFG